MSKVVVTRNVWNEKKKDLSFYLFPILVTFTYLENGLHFDMNIVFPHGIPWNRLHDPQRFRNGLVSDALQLFINLQLQRIPLPPDSKFNLKMQVDVRMPGAT